LKQRVEEEREMAIVVLQGKLRKDTGKGSARRTRMRGSIPGVIYGEGEVPISFEAGRYDFEAMIHTVSGENVIVDLKLEGDSTDRKAIIREIQRDPIRGTLICSTSPSRRRSPWTSRW
jgi:large subunit ribosomal protein L25